MAFVYQSKRDFNFSKNENITLGPGAYVGHVELKVQKCEVPFHSTSLRDVSHKISPLPGPGAYNSSNNLLKVDQFGRLRCSSSFAGKKNRFGRMTNELNPGPGSYNLKSNWDYTKRSLSTKSNSKVLHTFPSVPSIPAQGQSFGYDETESGDLVCQKNPIPVYAGVGKDSIGPGHYNPKPVTEIYGKQGTVWHKSASKREISQKTNSNLGPGSYSDLRPNNWYKLKGSAAFVSSCKRDSYIPGNEEDDYDDRDGNPGPGMYFLGNQASFKPGTEFQKFGTGEKRFKDPSTSVPGPGTYKEEVAKENPQKKAPFASTELRFGLNKINKIPGPGTYKEVDFEEFMKKKNQTKKPDAFGVSEKRFNSKSQPNGPGPGEYEMKIQVGIHNTAKQKPSSVFESRVERLKNNNQDFPAPGSYNVPSEFNKAASKPPGGFYKWDRHRFDCEEPKLPLTDDRGKKPNNLEKKMLEKYIEIPEKNTSDETGPGPWTYFKKFGKSRKEKPAVVSKVNRFNKLESENPGPGEYEGGNSQWNKKTFNIKFTDFKYLS